MPTRCIVAGCGNTSRDGVSLHEWPKDAKRFRLWRNFVTQTRAKWSGPNPRSVICSAHFRDDQFSNKHKFDAGFDKKRILIDEAVPSIYPTSVKRKEVTGGSSKDLRSAYRKREVNRILAQNECPESLDVPAPFESDIGVSEDIPASTIAIVNAMEDACFQVSPSTRNVTTCTEEKLMGTLKIRRSKSIQTDILKIKTSDRAVQTKNLRSIPRASTPVISASSSEDEFNDPHDSTWEVEEGDLSIHEREEPLPQEEKKYIVFRSQLWQLFEKCPHCSNPCSVQEVFTKGSMIKVSQTCQFQSCGYRRTWESQPYVSNIPAGNLLISGAITFTGLSPSKVLRLFQVAGIETISTSTYHSHNDLYIYPTVWKCWQEDQLNNRALLKERGDKLQCAGDGRADSPGHSAKYGTYTLLETVINKILTIEIVQSNEVGGSARMEKEGLLRCIRYLKSHSLQLGTLVTDRHPSIQKTMREEYPEVMHYYDIWHVAKGFSKKAEALAKQKECEEIRPWVKSMVNHMYWCATSTPNGNPNIIEAKWRSLANHIQNIHVGFDDDYFPQCEHLRMNRRPRRKKKWLKPYTKACEKICELILNTRLCKDVRKLSPCVQTSSVEAVHSLILHWTPKMTAFSYSGMLIRHYLACLHYNENSQREQKITLQGNPAYYIVFPKAKGGDYTVKKVKVDASYDYVGALFSTLFNKVISSPSGYQEMWKTSFTEPPSLASQYERPDKQAAIEKFKNATRYRTSDASH